MLKSLPFVGTLTSLPRARRAWILDSAVFRHDRPDAPVVHSAVRVQTGRTPHSDPIRFIEQTPVKALQITATHRMDGAMQSLSTARQCLWTSRRTGLNDIRKRPVRQKNGSA
jgi:hypothetical protein